jgi:hypothetical protein
MITSQEYRRMAEECFGWAREAQTDEVRLYYVNLAQTWLEAATWIEHACGRCSQAPPAPMDRFDPPRQAA